MRSTLTGGSRKGVGAPMARGSKNLRGNFMMRPNLDDALHTMSDYDALQLPQTCVTLPLSPLT